MKVALVRPNYHSHLITPILGLGYISSYLKERGIDCNIIDALNQDLSPEETANRCTEADLVGINCLSDYYPQVIELTKRLKDMGKKVVIGGPHATVLPRETMEETGADYVVVGEGEETMFELSLRLERGEMNGKENPVAGLYTGNNRAVTRRPFIKDLNTLPFPDWKEMDPRRYKKAPHGGFVKRFPVAPITSTRGCPFECTFCASPELWGRRIRYRSPENVVDEIEYLVKEFGVREIHFEDDNLTLKRSHVEAICELILERRLDISWATPNGIRVDTITPGLLRLMKKSGCYFIAFGIESGNESILRNIKKETDLKTITYAVKEAKKAGVMTQGFFIFGLPGETEETIQQTIDYAKSIPLDKAQFLLLDVLSGSKIWHDVKDRVRLDLSRRSYQEVTWVPDTIDREVLVKAPSRAFKEFFLRPHQIMCVLRYVKPSQIGFVLRRMKDFGVLPARRVSKRA